MTNIAEYIGEDIRESGKGQNEPAWVIMLTKIPGYF